MAIETLLDPGPRSPAATAHLQDLIKETKDAYGLAPQERDSLLGSFDWLLFESINRTGRVLAKQRLGTRLYAGKEAPEFFSYCYDLRSRLVHGKFPPPTQQEIASGVGQLEVFVSDLLAGDLLKIE
jgi:hypothetical protein